jgi:hypothetical protein
MRQTSGLCEDCLLTYADEIELVEGCQQKQKTVPSEKKQNSQRKDAKDRKARKEAIQIRNSKFPILPRSPPTHPTRGVARHNSPLSDLLLIISGIQNLTPEAIA